MGVQENYKDLLSQSRRQRKNHTGKLQELALLLPVAPKIGPKKLTKKEILLHILHYIQHLQRSADVTKALLRRHISSGDGGLGGLYWSPALGPVRRRHSTPSISPFSQKSHLWGACQKPWKKKQLVGASEHQTQAQNPQCCPALDKSKKWVAPCPGQQGGSVGGPTTPARGPNPCSHPKAVSSAPQWDRKEGRSWLVLLDTAEDSCCGKRSAQDVGTYHAFQVQQGPERIRFLNRTQTCSRAPDPCLLNSTSCRQNLVFYDSSEEADKESRNSDPWLPAWIPEGSPHGSPLALEPPQISNWSVTGHPSEILGFSPTLFSSPGKLLSEEILEDGTECLTQALFEEVFSDPALSPSACMPEAPRKKETFPEAPRDPPDFHSLCQPSVSLDNFYLSLDKNIVTQSSFEDPDTELVWNQQENAPANPQGLQSSSAEDRDYTWTTTQRISALSTAGRKARKGQGGRGPMKLKENMRAPCPTQRKKKCVNGFIMFCRMNRKQYIRASPGTPSTDATKELAQLWRGMTVQERRPYCIKARRFSLRHNRIVRQDSSSSEDEDWETPKPFYQLLAEKARRSPNVSSRLPPHQD
nr:meiosis initiator protein [Manis javanica]